MARRLGPAVITMIVVDVVLIVVLVALMVTAPQAPQEAPTEDTTNPAAPTTTASQEDATTPSSTQAVTVPEGALDLAEFTTPSGNIWCTLGDDAASCQIGDTSYQPPAVDGCGDNDLVGRVLTVTDDQAEFPCPDGDIAGPPAGERTVLEYEQVTAVGDFMCSSSETGVRCQSLVSGRGFTVARAGATTF